MKRIIAGLALAGLSIAGASAADRLHVKETTTIAAPPAKVWDVIKNFGDMSWVPPVTNTTATKGNHPGSVRTITLGGPKLVEQLDHYNPARRDYTYHITPLASNMKTLPVSHYRSTISVAAAPGGKSLVTWVGSFERADPSADPAAGMDDAAAVRAVKGVYQAGFEGLAKHVGGQ